MEAKNELQRNAIALERRKMLESYQRALDIEWMNDRMEDGRMGRCLALIQREAEMEREFQERTDHSAIVNSRCRKETDLGVEIAKVKREEANTLLRRHYLRERDPQLRELMKKLQAGYVCRDLKQQMLHNEYKRLQDKAEEQRANTILLNSMNGVQEEEKLQALEKYKAASQYRNELQNQLVNRQQAKLCQYEDTLIEKKMLEDIMRTISDEDKKELERSRAMTASMRREMESSRLARDAWRRKQRDLMLLEERALQAQIQQAGDRQAALIAKRKSILKQREEMNEIIAAKILADEAERTERANIIKALQEQEFLEMNHQDDLKTKSKQEKVKAETMESLTAQKKLKAKEVQDEKEREIQLRKEAEKKKAIEDAKEKEKELAKREKNQQYKQDLLRQIAENKVKKTLEEKSEAQRAQNIWDHQAAWQAETTMERERILSEHGGGLLGWLQAGVLRPRDLAAVARALPAPLAPADLAALSAASRPKRFAKCNPQCWVLRDY